MHYYHRQTSDCEIKRCVSRHYICVHIMLMVYCHIFRLAYVATFRHFTCKFEDSTDHAMQHVLKFKRESLESVKLCQAHKA